MNETKNIEKNYNIAKTLAVQNISAMNKSINCGNSCAEYRYANKPLSYAKLNWLMINTAQ